MAIVAEIEARRKYVSTIKGMEEGSVAILDALGFKRLSNRNPADALQALKGLDREMRKMARKSDLKADFEIVFLSDTVVIGCKCQVGEPEFVALRNCIILTSALCYSAIDANPLLLYRGTVTFGSFAIEDKKFLIGPAINEASIYHESANAAVVWLAPSALEVLEGCDERSPLHPHNFIRDFPVPFKDGSKFFSKIVNPFPFDRQQSYKAKISRVKESFKGETTQPLDLAIKQQVTLEAYECFAPSAH